MLSTRPRAFPRLPRPVFFFVLLSLLLTQAVKAQSVPQADLNFLSPLEREVVQEINLARSNPQQYASYLEQMKPHFKGNTYQPPGKTGLVTQEGLGALDDAINFLRSAKPLSPYAVSKGMCSGAGVHAKDLGPKGATGHKGSDGSFCEQRVARFGSWEGDIGENISYGSESAREQVIYLLIDDGVTNRGHRRRLLSPSYKVVGVSCGSHTQSGGVCVITFAGGFADKATAGAAKTADATQQSSREVRKF